MKDFKTSPSQEYCKQIINILTIGENRVYTRVQLEAVPEERLERLLHDGCYLLDYDLFMVFTDGSEYMNHSYSPNIQIIYPAFKFYRDLISVAIRRINKGEEIVENYVNYLTTRGEWISALMQKYYPEKMDLQLQIHQAQIEKK